MGEEKMSTTLHKKLNFSVDALLSKPEESLNTETIEEKTETRSQITEEQIADLESFDRETYSTASDDRDILSPTAERTMTLPTVADSRLTMTAMLQHRAELLRQTQSLTQNPLIYPWLLSSGLMGNPLNTSSILTQSHLFPAAGKSLDYVTSHISSTRAIRIFCHESNRSRLSNFAAFMPFNMKILICIFQALLSKLIGTFKEICFHINRFSYVRPTIDTCQVYTKKAQVKQKAQNTIHHATAGAIRKEIQH